MDGSVCRIYPGPPTHARLIHTHTSKTPQPARPTAVANVMHGYFSRLIPPFPDPPRYNRKDGFEMYLGEDTSKAGVFPNLDASYLCVVFAIAPNSG
jgi:hypothetical protein